MPRRIAVRLGWVASLSLSVYACGARATPTVVPPEPRATPPAPVVEVAPSPPVMVAPPPVVVELVPPVPKPSPDPAPPVEPVAAACSLITGPGDTIRTVALTNPIEASHAPYPRNDGERFLFRQVYDTLVRVDCEGRLQPGLASHWRLDPTGPTWVLTIDSEARFSDGTPVTTADVLAAWGEPGRGAALRPWIRQFVRSMVAVNSRVIGITLHDPDSAESLRALANPALAIARRQPGAPWPLGTTGFRVIEHQIGDVAAVTLGRHSWGRGDPEPAASGQVRFLVAPDADLRDHLEPSDEPGPPVDLLVTRDPAVLSYAAVVPAFRAVPLEWLRTHTLLSPAREPPRGSGQAVFDDDARQALAIDAVRGEARGATGPFWWQLSDACEAGVPYRRSRPVSGAAYARRVVFSANDPVAGGLAARLVALTAFGDPDLAKLTRGLFPMGTAEMSAVGLSATEFDRALTDGLDSGYVMALPRRPFGPCQEARTLTSRAVWLVRSAAALDAAVVPLLDTRMWAVIRRGRAGVAAEWDGVLLLDGVRQVGP